MKTTQLFAAGTGFKILQTTGRSQTALMTLEPGEASSEQPSVHDESDQTLVVLEGEVTAEVAGESETLQTGGVVLVPAETPHRFINRGAKRAITFSVYAGPAYPSASR